MKYLFSIIFFFTIQAIFAQCYDLLSHKLDSVNTTPYAMVDKRVHEIISGKTIAIKLDDVKYKTKLAFLFQTYNLGDTLDVTLMTLNRKILVKKKITDTDFILRYDPFKKTENYFLIIKTQEEKDETSVVIKGCMGLVIMERVIKKPFKKVQDIKWKKN
jgi:hypothetical protein